MTSVYASAAASATKLISAKGKSATFTRTTVAHNPLAQTNVATSTQYTLPTVAIPVGPTSQYRIAAGLVGKNILRFIVAPGTTGVRPQPGDTVLWGGETYTLRDVSITAPAADQDVVADCIGEI